MAVASISGVRCRGEALLVLLVLASGCSGKHLGDPPEQDFLTSAPRDPSGDGSSAEDAETAPDRTGPSQPSASTKTRTTWAGKAASIPPVAFGGGPTNACRFSVAFDDVKVELVVDSLDSVLSAKVTALVLETTIDECKPIPAHVHTYRFEAPAGSGASEVRLRADPSNQPVAELFLTRGVATGRSLPVALRARRTDQGPPYDWTVSFDVALAPRSP